MSDLNKGDILCDSCFQQRKNNANDTKTEHIMTSNFASYFIPYIGSIKFYSNVYKYITSTDGYVHRIYFNSVDEEWYKNQKYGTCSECNNYVNTYYQLEKKNFHFFENPISKIINLL